MKLARHLHGAAHARQVERRPAGARQLGIDEAEVEGGVVRDHRRVAEKLEQLVDQACEQRLVGKELACTAMTAVGLCRHVEVGGEVRSGERRVGQECVSKERSRKSPYHKK